MRSPRRPTQVAREHIHDALTGLYRAHIETIHAFAATLLRERPVEAGLDPAFEVADGLARSSRSTPPTPTSRPGCSTDRCPRSASALNRGFGVEEIRALTQVIDRHRSLLPLQLDLSQPADVDGFVGALPRARRRDPRRCCRSRRATRRPPRRWRRSSRSTTARRDAERQRLARSGDPRLGAQVSEDRRQRRSTGTTAELQADEGDLRRAARGDRGDPAPRCARRRSAG